MHAFLRTYIYRKRIFKNLPLLHMARLTFNKLRGDLFCKKKIQLVSDSVVVAVVEFKTNCLTGYLGPGGLPYGGSPPSVSF